MIIILFLLTVIAMMMMMMMIYEPWSPNYWFPKIMAIRSGWATGIPFPFCRF